MEACDSSYFATFHLNTRAHTHTHTVFSMLSTIRCSQHTVQVGSHQPQGPHPKGKCNYIQPLYQDVRNA